MVHQAGWWRRAWVPLRHLRLTTTDEDGLIREMVMWALYNINHRRLIAERYWQQWAVFHLCLIPIFPTQMVMELKEEDEEECAIV